MKKIIYGLLAAVALTSCSNYGKKVNIEGTKGEVYFKGDGVTEADSKKLGEYLKNVIHYFSDDKALTVQLMKAKDEGYDIRFVVDEKKLNASPEALQFFEQIGPAMSIDLYDNKAVNVFLTDTHLNDFKSIPFDKEVIKKLQEEMKPTVTEDAPADTTGNANQ